MHRLGRQRTCLSEELAHHAGPVNFSFAIYAQEDDVCRLVIFEKSGLQHAEAGS
jgi:hypothetical protein